MARPRAEACLIGLQQHEFPATNGICLFDSNRCLSGPVGHRTHSQIFSPNDEAATMVEFCEQRSWAARDLAGDIEGGLGRFELGDTLGKRLRLAVEFLSHQVGIVIAYYK